MEVGDRIDEWVNQYVRGVLSEKDRIELLRWLGGAPEHEKQFREMLRIAIRVSAVGQWSELDDIQQRTWDKITPFIERRRKKLGDSDCFGDHYDGWSRINMAEWIGSGDWDNAGFQCATS